jgi:hypothetical protein
LLLLLLLLLWLWLWFNGPRSRHTTVDRRSSSSWLLSSISKHKQARDQAWQRCN